MPPKQAPTEIAYYWVSRATSVALAMVTPGVAGVWFDSRFDSAPIASIAGSVFGLALAMLMLISIANRGQSRQDDSLNDPTDRHTD